MYFPSLFHGHMELVHTFHHIIEILIHDKINPLWSPLNSIFLTTLFVVKKTLNLYLLDKERHEVISKKDHIYWQFACNKIPIP